MMMSTEAMKSLLKERGKLVESYLATCLDGQEMPPRLRESMLYSLQAGGKRLRPVLCLSCAALCSLKPEDVLPFASAIEMVHTYSLIHDDLPAMDDDDLRRGKPSNHKAFDEATAILAGDALLTDAFAHMCRVELPAGQVLRAVAEFARAAGSSGMVGGQCIDLESQGKTADLDLLWKMDQGKTVALISAACQMGCIAAGAGEKALENARRYAEGVGMAFQIRDDILDVLGDAQTLGKNVGMDSARDKRNYVSLLGVEEAQRRVDSYTAQALKALEGFQGDTLFLKELAESLATRDK